MNICTMNIAVLKLKCQTTFIAELFTATDSDAFLSSYRALSLSMFGSKCTTAEDVTKQLYYSVCNSNISIYFYIS